MTEMEYYSCKHIKARELQNLPNADNLYVVLVGTYFML